MNRRHWLQSLLACLIPSRLFADESTYWRARVNASLAIQEAERNPWYPPVPPKAPESPPPKSPELPKRAVVTMYTATWCAPCQTAKAALKSASKLPFDVVHVDVSNGGQPSWCSSIPAFSWDANGQTRFVLGFPGVAQLVKRWENSQKPAKSTAEADSYSPGWSWPGSLRQHLLTAHHVPEAATLSQDNLERLHDALHNGYSLSQIRAYAKRRGWIQ